MKGSTIAAMILAAAAASAATVVALKKARDKKQMQEEDACDFSCACGDDTQKEDANFTEVAEEADAVECDACPVDTQEEDEDNTDADQPAKLRMPENANADSEVTSTEA